MPRVFSSSRFLGTLAIAIFALALFSMPILNAKKAYAADDTSAAQAFIQKLGNKALTSLTIKGIPDGERETRVRKLLSQNFDIYTIGRFALGTYWRQADADQKKQYLNLFENMIVHTYARRFADYNGQKFEVGSTYPGGGHDTMVKSEILQKDGPPVHIDWRVRDKGGSLKVVDVIVEQISMSVTQRDDFRSVINAGGGNIDALLKKLKSF